MRNKNHKLFFYVIFTFIVILAYLVARPYLMLLVLAFAISAMLQPVYLFFKKLFKGNKSLSSAVTLLIFLFIIFIPLTLLTDMVFQQIKVFYSDFNHILEDNNNFVEDTTQKINVFLSKLPVSTNPISKEQIIGFLKDNIQPITNFVLDNVINIGKAVFNSVPKFVIFLFILGALIPMQENLIDLIKNLSPLSEEIDNMFLQKFLAMSQAMIKGSFIIAIVQGVISGIALKIAGVPYVLFWTLIMIFLSIIPLGSGILMIPIAIVLILFGHIWQGILFILNHFLVIVNIDNLLRPRLVPKEANLHPILTLIGALGGLELFGFFGVIFGPVIMILLVTTIEIYLKYFKKS